MLTDDEMSADGILSLVTDMWRQVHQDLQSEQPKVQLAAYGWLHSPYFERWLGFCGGKDPEVARQRILDLYWPQDVTVEQVMERAAERAAVKNEKDRAYHQQRRKRKAA